MEQLANLASKVLSPNSKTEPTNLDKAKYLEAARMLLGCYRTGDANDPEIYIAAVVRVLSGYPLDVVHRVIDPLTGLPSRIKWLPNVPEVLAACEEIHGLNRRIRESEERSKEQLAERAEIERAKQEHETVDEMWADMERRGWKPTAERKVPTFETVESVKLKHKITDEQWAAIPDLPKASWFWEGKRWHGKS